MAQQNQQDDEKFGYLRERVSALEAVIAIHQDMLKEVRDAVSGINTSLRVLASIEERVVTIQESWLDTRERLKLAESAIADLQGKTGLNSHGRALWESSASLAVAAVIGAVSTFFLIRLFGG